MSEIKRKRVRKSREERAAEILESATRVFVDEGYPELTLRRVAKEVGVSLSTVQHYFDSRESVIRAMVASRISKYKEQHASMISELSGSKEDKIRAIFWSLIVDGLNRETCRFFTQVWAMSFLSEVFSAQLFELYNAHREDLADLIVMLRPELSDHECFQRATLVSSMIEGSVIHLGNGLPSDERLEGMRERMLEASMRLVTS